MLQNGAGDRRSAAHCCNGRLETLSFLFVPLCCPVFVIFTLCRFTIVCPLKPLEQVPRSPLPTPLSFPRFSFFLSFFDGPPLNAARGSEGALYKLPRFGVSMKPQPRSILGSYIMYVPEKSFWKQAKQAKLYMNMFEQIWYFWRLLLFCIVDRLKLHPLPPWTTEKLPTYYYSVQFRLFDPIQTVTW